MGLNNNPKATAAQPLTVRLISIFWDVIRSVVWSPTPLILVFVAL